MPLTSMTATFGAAAPGIAVASSEANRTIASAGADRLMVDLSYSTPSDKPARTNSSTASFVSSSGAGGACVADQVPVSPIASAVNVPVAPLPAMVPP